MNNKFLEQAKAEAQNKKKTPPVAKMPKVGKEKKTATLTTVLTPTNKEKLTQLAQEAGMSVAELIAYWIENNETE
ncbi:TPA: hypothetical protein ITS68_002674 [Enterococcus faecalis]|uniref:hypothetical protein n=1 Tax=Lactobacillales TaxID=186826 RepID=UPI0011432ED4|nr:MULTISPECIES: hypothetical protein [Lactobacillales]MCL4596061.1 hypothetical protein [Enterococcus faecalis]MDB1685319.1 hypothetical protein [Enterococcus durans]MDM7644483.1 hypothetical protein [Lactococcus lactis]MDN5652061.1 hypothetical protein [Lactococcus lactis]NSW26344.1 hypothetical protein [Enterococcus faecalis]